MLGSGRKAFSGEAPGRKEPAEGPVLAAEDAAHGQTR